MYRLHSDIHSFPHDGQINQQLHCQSLKVRRGGSQGVGLLRLQPHLLKS